MSQEPIQPNEIENVLSTEKSIYEEIGGSPVIDSVIEKFFDDVSTDPRLVSFFESVDMARLREQGKKYFAQLLGGPAEYDGKGIQSAHQHLPIDLSHFTKVIEHLVHSFQAMGVQGVQIAKVVSLLAPLESEILNADHDAEADDGLAESAPLASDDFAPDEGEITAEEGDDDLGPVSDADIEAEVEAEALDELFQDDLFAQSDDEFLSRGEVVDDLDALEDIFEDEDVSAIEEVSATEEVSTPEEASAPEEASLEQASVFEEENVTPWEPESEDEVSAEFEYSESQHQEDLSGEAQGAGRPEGNFETIVAQSRFLATNAANEAARAKELERRLSEIADDMGRLASEAEQASEEIAQKKEKIRTTCQTVVDSLSQISNLIEQINDTSRSLVNSFEGRMGLANEFAGQIDDYSQGANGILEKVTGVNDALRNAHTSADRAKSSSNEFLELSKKLIELVDQI